MDSTRQSPRSRYAVTDAGEAERRTAAILAEVGLHTDVGLDDRLTAELRQWMGEAAARNLANEARHLYQLLTQADRDEPDRPVDPIAFRRALLLAMTRPEDDPCWRDYQELLVAIEEHHRTVQAAYRVGPVRRTQRAVTRWRPDRAEVESWTRPLIDARARFVATWR